MRTYEENLNLIESLKDFKGGDNYDVPIDSKALNDMKYIIEECNKFDVLQPKIFPFAGGSGIQAEWECEWYLEIDSCNEYISILFMKDKETVNTPVSNIRDAFILAKQFLNSR